MLHSPQKMVKVLFLNELQRWEDYVEAFLRLEPQEDEEASLLLTLTHILPPNRLTVLPLVQIFCEKEKTIRIGLEMISQVERLEDLIIAIKLQEWGRVLALSFRDEDYCSLVHQQIQLGVASANQLPCKAEELIKYIAKDIDCAELAFENTNIANTFFRIIMEMELPVDQERQAFKIVKKVFLQARKDILLIFLKEEYFKAVLKCLSFNFQFGDRRVDYIAEYQKISQCRNILQLEQQHVISYYRDIMKIRYLINSPTSMFIEPNLQFVLNEIIRQNTISIISFLNQHPGFLTRYKSLALTDPVIFIELFSELWEMFKLVIVLSCNQTTQLKSTFHGLFLKENLLEITFECVMKVILENKNDLRLYQKFMDSLNPFLSFKWNQSQDFLVYFYRNNQVHLLKILLLILEVSDYNTKSLVLQFARYLLQPSDNRKSMKQAFLSYVFIEFVNKIDSFFSTPEEIQALMSFLLRCYQIDHNRTRRCITEGNIIDRLEQRCENKYILILIVRFLRSLLEYRFEEIFIYLERHKCFSFLREAYYRAKRFSPRGILYSMFLGLIRDLQKSDNRSGVRYIFDILCPDSSS